MNSQQVLRTMDNPLKPAKESQDREHPARLDADLSPLKDVPSLPALPFTTPIETIALALQWDSQNRLS